VAKLEKQEVIRNADIKVIAIQESRIKLEDFGSYVSINAKPATEEKGT
jgi:hypothetical protein